MIREETIHSNGCRPAPSSRGGRTAGPRRRASFIDDTEHERRAPPLRRYRAGFVTRASAQQLMQCKSPSSCSTTSLAQLREKLTLLSPLNFTKVPVRIAATPELPALKEQDEYDRLSSSDPRPATVRRCGVSLKNQYHSDSEALTIVKETRYLTPVVEEHSASLNLVAALGPTEQSAIYDAFDQLYSKNAKVDLVDLLVEEAIEHAQDKDSGIISGKVTQDSDIVEDTPVEELRRKKLSLKRRSRHIEEKKYSTDDSDVVDGTPVYDYDWKNRRRPTSDKTNTNDESATLNDEAVSAYFGQLTNIDIDNLISPATIKNLSRSHSREEHREEDCVFIDDINVTFEADIIDCVNSLLDKVCIDIDKCFDLLADEDQQLDILGISDNNDYRSMNTAKMSKMYQQIPKSAEDTLNEHDTDGTKTVTLKFKNKKKAPKVNTTRQKKGKRKINQNDIQEDCVLKENTNKSPSNNTEQLIIKKRKLYSSKDDDNENQDITTSRIERRPSTSKESPIAACYKELENARKSRIRLPRKRASSQPVISPKTKKLNDMFDKIKDNVVNDEKITLVDKKSEKDLYQYNISSESDDGAFKKKKTQVQKRISSSSLESTSKHGRLVKSVNYTSYYSSEDECQKAVKPKRGKQTKLRNRKVKNNPRTKLIDERMRVQQPEVLETSFVQEKGDTNTYEEPEPTLQAPVLEAIISDDIVNEPIVPVNKTRTPNRSEIIKIKTEKSFKKKTEKLTKPNIHKNKAIVNNLVTERESATVSPLPGLVVETEPRKDDMTSLDGNLLQKLKNIYIDVDELNKTPDTQNMLLNNNNYEKEIDILSETDDQQNLSINLGNYNDNAIIMSDSASEKSIATGGRSPITGHNNSDERPPNLDTLYESFQHRDVDIEGKGKSIAEFIIKMRNQTTKSKVAASNTSPVILTRMSTKDSVRSNSCKRKILEDPNRKSVATSSDIVSDKSNPRVLLERWSSKDIESLQNPVTPKSKSSIEFEKKLTPARTHNSISTGPSVPIVVLDRVLSDEISKWLPMPGTKIVEKPNITRQIITRRRSIANKCITSSATKPKISPVKLNFDIVDLTNTKVTRSRSRSIKSIPSRTYIEKLNTKSVNSAKEKSNMDQGVSSQETEIQSSEETANVLNQGKTIGSTVDPSEMNKSVASVQSWIKRNAAANSSKKDDNARKDLPKILYQEVMETLRTRLVEINEKTGEAMQAAFLQDQEKLTRLVEEVDSLKARIVALQKSKMEQACALIRTDAENKARMVQLLKEDMTRLFK